jgi:Lon protease-like protein
MIDEPRARYRLPLFPLPAVLMPTSVLPLHIFEERYRKMVDRCLKTDRRFGVVYHDADERGPFLMEEGRVGCLAEIQDFEPLPDGRSLLVVRGVERFSLMDGIESGALFYEGLVAPYDDRPSQESVRRQERHRALALFGQVVDGLTDRPKRLPDLDPNEEVSFPLASTLETTPSWQQDFLEMRDEVLRLKLLGAVFRAVLD